MTKPDLSAVMKRPYLLITEGMQAGIPFKAYGQIAAAAFATEEEAIAVAMQQANVSRSKNTLYELKSVIRPKDVPAEVIPIDLPIT